MDALTLNKLGKRAFVQSLKPYHGGIKTSVAIFGLDTEYVPHQGKASDLICWQLASDNEVRLISNQSLTIKNLFQEAKRQLHSESRKLYVFVCFFSLAEIQFFDLSEWVVNEFKGKYRLTQSYGDTEIQVIDLANWYPKQSLASVAKLWGEAKENDELDKLVAKWGLTNPEDKNAPIGKLVESIDRGEHTKEKLLKAPEFISYAKNDPVITQRIFVKIRQYFLDKFEVDIISTMTPANTSASIFRKSLHKVIDQRDTTLRSMALRCCWGGRMEAIFRGEKSQVFEYDATGHHPNSCIALKTLPTGTDWLKTTNTTQWFNGISGFGMVYFTFPEDEKYPCLPIYDMDSLLYVLEGLSFCSLSEAKLAREMGAKVQLFNGYYYNQGTNVLPKYLERLQVIRNHSTDDAERQSLKLLSNSVIGKLFQKSVGVDIALVQKYAEEHQIPVEEAIRVEGVDFGTGEVKVGSCFYPEWYALILGKARATISRQARDNEALIISSDSFVTEHDLGEEFDSEGIHYSKRSTGKLVSYRTRFYRVGEKLAHHAVHEAEASKDVLDHFRESDEPYRYGYYRFLQLKESWRDHKPFGSRVFKPMSVKLGFDYKRKLLLDGTTVPWKTTIERNTFLEEMK